MVRVGTWNVENLFLPGGEAGPSTKEAYEQKLNALADTINALRWTFSRSRKLGLPQPWTTLLPG